MGYRSPRTPTRLDAVADAVAVAVADAVADAVAAGVGGIEHCSSSPRKASDHGTISAWRNRYGGGAVIDRSG